MGDRIEVICSDVMKQGELIATADVVVMNNVFDAFVPVDVQKKLWLFLFSVFKKSGTLLVTYPSLEENLIAAGLDETDIDVASLVNKVPVSFANLSEAMLHEVEGFSLYRVK
eukprot:TRINITY_DN3568_c1_g1_i2.p1 TRINITY_DN3568_c1_g1~~TRINITY_DN3568_c1_g1_i2.p1  ORF type:complete len:112 (-),score=27.85 TRINITY_DN3568_c1_g1_i2:42-377(-)